ncbi:MAG TPA: NAD(P)(+) transhydrogenase (Re/Si-specific) subunit beta, partial [Thermodesulfobacteriota bacterium]|nr:NAD(P)(+) transhydrogenase (Re/Si-specific) subunit beta [Thermodesulfobacteriota bacterium]
MMVTNVVYLIAAVLFIIGLKMLSSPKTARRGNIISGIGMALAIIITLFDRQIANFTWIIIGLIIGSAIGVFAAKKVQMTEMPQMVALLNGFGGGASTLVAISEYSHISADPAISLIVTIVLSVLVGTVTFTGSLIAYAKLQGLMTGAPIVYKMQNILNGVIMAVIVVLGILMIFNPSAWGFLLLILAISGVLEVLSVIPIGGADMPVVISLLNSYSGIAAAFTGFVISNTVLIISGALVGASGIILCMLMCRAMNRSLTNVLFAAVGFESSGAEAGAGGKTVTRYTPDDAAWILE